MLGRLFSSLKTSCFKVFNLRARSKDPALDSFLIQCENDPFTNFMRLTIHTPTDAFPETIEVTPDNAPILVRIFGEPHNDQGFFDLAAYEAISPGLGRRVWDMIEAERAHQQFLAEHPNLKADAARFGYKLP